ncbi:hypothetical protein, partial [Desulfovibrio desulfuricans]|uniref:hypothetical protein n=1 Tax=Desulfovibrio desulfuricans TaxID=876 RepID=UPI0035B1B2D8
RLFRPDGVNVAFLMLTYTSTLRSKARRFLVRPKNAYFANSPTRAIAFASLQRVQGRRRHDLLLVVRGRSDAYAIRLILAAAIRGAERGKNTAGGWRGGRGRKGKKGKSA